MKLSVTREEYEEILLHPIPPHTTTFCERRMKEAVARTIALDLDEKRDFLASLARMSQDDIDHNLKVLEVGNIMADFLRTPPATAEDVDRLRRIEAILDEIDDAEDVN